jgi:serine/threonine-protein kinase
VDPLLSLTDALKDRYDVERELGAGGMATVYLARDIKHNRRVALKVLRPDLGAVLGVERFLSEIQVTANLQHPNLLPLFDSGEANGLLFYVMPFVEGESLRSRLDREKQLPINDALHIATAVASALEYAHARGVIHRDLKPENILMQSGEPVIADFGIALAVSNAGGGRITQTGISLGTPQYMSPEQATGDRGIDGRTDIYSLGAVTYEMLAGEPPHLGTNAQAIIARVLTEKPTGLRVTRPNVAEHVEAAVLRALEKLPADRWATAREFADALGNRAVALSGIGVTSRTVAGAPSPRALTWRESLQIPFVRAVLAGFALVVAGAGARELTRPARENARAPVRFALTFDDSVQLVSGTGSPMALSPDGAVLAFVGTTGRGPAHLYVRQLADPLPREVAATDGASQPFFSPDGQWIGYAVGAQLLKVPLRGGTPQSLAEVPGLQGASWVWSDRIVVATQGQLATVPVTGGELEVFAVPDTADGEVGLRWPLALPDGKTVLYGSWSRAGLEQMRVGVASLNGRKRRVLDLAGTHPLAVLDGTLVYANAAGAIMAVPFDARGARHGGTPIPAIEGVLIGSAGPLKGTLAGGGSLAYASGRVDETAQLMIASPPAAPRWLLAESRVYAFPRYSPDGRHLALSVRSRDTSDVWILDLPGGPLRRLTTAQGTINDRPEWTPDSRSVLFRSNRGGRRAIWSQPADGNRGAELLFEFASAGVDEAVLSSDASHLFVQLDTTRTAQGGQVFFRRMRGDTAARLIAGADRGQQVHPRPSPNGQWIAYASSELGTWEVYVKPFPALDARHQVSLQGGSQPVWSRDGRRLYYLTPDMRLVRAALTFSPTFTVASRDTVLENVASNSLNAGTGSTGVGTGFFHANYDVAPDGRSIVFLRSAASDARIMIVHDWKYELQERMRAGRN